MKKLFVIFLLLINFLFSSAYGQDENFYANNFNKTPQISANYKSNNIISVDFKEYENAVLRLNQNQEKISALFSQNNNRINNTEFTSDKKYLKTKFYKNNTKITFTNSDRISLNLENEIYTRAP